MKRISWVGNSKDDVKAFPMGARREAGFQLSKLQQGEDPDDWKPMGTIGPGVREIRIRDASGAFRILYVARLAAAVYGLHAFQKKSQQTRARDLDLARERFQSISRHP